MVTRCPERPILTPDMVIPSSPDMRVDGIFNCGVAELNGEVILLCRVAESVKPRAAHLVGVPTLRPDKKLAIQWFDKTRDTQYDYSDSRSVLRIVNGAKKVVKLTSLSHFRVARSRDGIHFTVDATPTLWPDPVTEEWGMEDPRVTRIGDRFCITYTSVTPAGAAVSLAETEDFVHFVRRGVIFAPENKDVALFPQKIGGMYYALHRPVPRIIGEPDIWLAESPDLVHWGRHRHVFSSLADGWSNGRCGAGAPPFLTEQGWVEIYHAVDKEGRYCLGALLLDRDDPGRVLAHTRQPFMVPQAEYERHGFFGNVVFACGLLRREGEIVLYYGASDDRIARAELEESWLLAQLQK